MDKWEYAAALIEATIEPAGVREHLQRKYPSWQNPPKYTAATLEPWLNRMGERGWELVHMEPAAGVGINGDIEFFGGYNTSTRWSRRFFLGLLYCT